MLRSVPATLLGVALVSSTTERPAATQSVPSEASVVDLEAVAATVSGAARSDSADAGDHELAELLRKAGRYVTEYRRSFDNLVAVETYEQQLHAFRLVRRHTRSDIVFVALEKPFPWGAYRDVFEVDGQPVRDRNARLERLFATQGRTTVQQARAIRDESARYNLGLYRDINEPTVPLMFLLPANQPRFRFERKGRRRFSGHEGIQVDFKEEGRPTMLRWKRRDDLPARGRFWIDAQKGIVFRSEILVDLPYLRLGQPRTARISVDYRLEPKLGLWVPSEMKEVYPDLNARAEYSGYRRLSVETQESIRVPR
jgi:hypothetical protein